MKKYVLDTPALLAYIENEAGADKVEKLILKAIDKELLISIISKIEIYYLSLREPGEEVANERLVLPDNLPIKENTLDKKTLKVIGKIKAFSPISLADCCIAGLTEVKKAPPVHKDPEYERFDNIIQMKLPYKIKRDGTNLS